MIYNDYNISIGTHRYTVSAVYEDGESVQVGPVVVETTEGLNESKEISIRVYPTCVNSMLTIESAVHNSFTLYNSLGQQILSGQIKVGSNMMDVSALSKGVYFIKLTEGGAVKIVKY